MASRKKDAKKDASKAVSAQARRIVFNTADQDWASLRPEMYTQWQVGTSLVDYLVERTVWSVKEKELSKRVP